MKLRTVYIRFFRAFNFDYLRANHSQASPSPWDSHEDGTFYPYISLAVDPELTCIVGANESGKSQLLQAIECAMGTRTPQPSDFCRYSSYFTVSETMKIPHFGLQFDNVTEDEQNSIIGIIDSPEITGFSSFHIFHTDNAESYLYLDSQPEPHPLATGKTDQLRKLLPRIVHIDPNLAIPNSVPISILTDTADKLGAGQIVARVDRWALVDPIVAGASTLISSLADPAALKEKLTSILQSTASPTMPNGRGYQGSNAELKLAHDLLVTVSQIHPSAFAELETALRRDDEGMANAIVATMNQHIDSYLNLTKWWSQDKQFKLAIAVRDYDLVFTVRDRTGSEYSFAERSDGLRYFLSYLVQFLTHIGTRSGSEILLMDEPDAFLSNQGQQDLLQILREFTQETDIDPSGQVVYVTHSPFLIDKNRADRIRVLDKGSDAEGTRVVRDVGANHFEPIRTALGGYVGESVFIGNCNLMLEGIADQVYLACMSALLHKEGYGVTEHLDLNRITLVPSGSASQVPYMVFLARGRDADKPPVIVLLDGDEEADRAVKTLKRGLRNKQLVKSEYISQIKPGAIPGVTSDRPGGPLDMEDLIPVELALDAARRYLEELRFPVPENFPCAEDVEGSLDESRGVFKTIQVKVAEAGVELHLEKVGFARHAVESCATSESDAAKNMRSRFASVFAHLTSMQRRAERERETASVKARVNRETSRFRRDFRGKKVTKETVVLLLERIKSLIDEAAEGSETLSYVRRMERQLALDRDLNEFIDDRKALDGLLDNLKYAEIYASQP